MHLKINILYIILLVSSILTGCKGNSSYKITGKVQNGIEGTPIEGAKLTLDGTDITSFTNDKGVFNIYAPNKTLNISLSIEKDGYKETTYKVKDYICDVTIGIIPNPGIFKPDDLYLENIPNTQLLQNEVNWSNIIDGVRKYHEKRIECLNPLRVSYWNRDLSSENAYSRSVETNRRNFREILGAVDVREDVELTRLQEVSETSRYKVSEINWTVLKEIVPRAPLQEWPDLDVPKQIFGEGLLLEPNIASKGYIIAIPDADQLPEDLVGLTDNVDPKSQFARHFAENGYTVVVPVIIDRTNRWSRGTNRTSRSWIYSQTHELGRTVTGFEVQKIEAIVDWIEQQNKLDHKIGIAGYGEGGLIAFYASALDTRVDVTLVSGYFAPREEIWKEPIYRNLWGLLKEFGDAEIATLIAPRSFIVEYSDVPAYDSEKNNGKKIDPPGDLWTHTFNEVESEFNRISSLTGENIGQRVLLKNGTNQTLPFGSEEALNAFMGYMGNNNPVHISNIIPVDTREEFDSRERMGRMVEQMVGHTQLLLRDSEYVRQEFTEEWDNQEDIRQFFQEEMVGWTHQDFLPINPRSKKVEEHDEYNVYEVLIDVLPNVEMWGVMLIPTDIEPGEKRSVVVLQHGRGGDPYKSLVETNTYYGISRRLAEKGFVVFSPFGNWTGETQFLWFDRIAKPSKKSLWTTVGRQHQQLIRWLSTLPFVDTDHIGIYGKSIGGQAASLIASMVSEYAVSINCAYFNEGARKHTSVYFPTSFVFHVDSEMPMWNRGHTLEYAEMANMLIFPRPFMVEHGKKDGIAPHGWVEHEYAKVQEYYTENGMEERTVLDHHEGGHIINGIKTIPFLAKHLDWPAAID